MPISFRVNLYGQIQNCLKEKLLTAADLAEPIQGFKDHPLRLWMLSSV